MMNQDDLELLSAYLDNELTPGELTRVKDFLSKSVEWREELEKLQEMKSLSSSLAPIAAPLDLLDLLEAEADKRVQKLSKRSWVPEIFSAPVGSWSFNGSLAAAALLLISVGVYQNHETSFMPLEPLLMAHAQMQSDMLPQRNAVNVLMQSTVAKPHATN